MARLFSIGHGARTFADFVALLRAAGVAQIADVRAYPGSRRYPHFGRAELERSLPAAGVAYAWLPALGGRRQAREGSAARHPGLREDAFRAYADHTETPEFAAGLERLLALAAARPTAFMCAERDPAGCHRSILADKLWSLGTGVEVVHLVAPDDSRVHRPPASLRLDPDRRLRYDVGTQAPLL